MSSTQVNIIIVNCVGDMFRSFTNVFCYCATVGDVRNWAYNLVVDYNVFTRCQSANDIRLQTSKHNGEPWPMYDNSAMLIAFVSDDCDTITITAYA